MKIDSQKFLPSSTGALSLIAVKGDKVVALSDSKKTIKFDNFISDVEEKKKTKKRSNIGSQFNVLKLELLKIKKVLIKGKKSDQKQSEKVRRIEEKKTRKKVENKLEEDKERKNKFANRLALPSMSILDAIKNFIGNILLGKFVLFLIDNYDRFIDFVKYIVPVTDFIVDLTGKIFNGIVSLIEGAYNINDAVRKEIEGVGGEGAVKEFDKFTDTFKRFLNLAIILTMAGIPTSIGGKDVVGKNKVKGPFKKFFVESKPKAVSSSPSKSSSIRKYLQRSKATKLIEKKYGNSAAKLYESARKSGKSVEQAKAVVDRAIKKGKIKVTPAGSGLLGKGATRGGLFKRGLGKVGSRLQTKVIGRGARLGINRVGLGVARGISRVRIPIIGPIIMGIMTYMETGKLDKALISAGSTALGAFLGSFIPIPVLGTILGGIIGEYIGDLFYELIKGDGGGPQALGKKLQRDIQKVIDGVKLVKDWIFKGVGNIQKQKGPEIDLSWFGIGKLKLGGWATLLNPFGNIFKKLKILRKAFFSESKEGSGRVIRKTGSGQDGAPGGAPGDGAGGASGGATGGRGSKLGSGNVSLNSLTDQDYEDLAYAVSGEAERDSDDEFGVAANILTRVVDPNHPNTIMGVFTAPGQYAAYSDGGARRDPQLAKRLKANKDKIAEAIQILNGRTDFKGTSEYGNMGPGDIKFSSRGNFYHYSSQKRKNDPPPANPPQHWKKLIKTKPQQPAQSKPKPKSLTRQEVQNLRKKISESKPGSGERIRIPGVGTFVRGRNIFGASTDKYFDAAGNQISEKEFKERFIKVHKSPAPTQQKPPNTPKATLQPEGTPVPGNQAALPASVSPNSNLNTDILETKAPYEQGPSTLLAIVPLIIREQQKDPFSFTNYPIPEFT